MAGRYACGRSERDSWGEDAVSHFSDNTASEGGPITRDAFSGIRSREHISRRSEFEGSEFEGSEYEGSSRPRSRRRNNGEEAAEDSFLLNETSAVPSSARSPHLLRANTGRDEIARYGRTVADLATNADPLRGAPIYAVEVNAWMATSE